MFSKIATKSGSWRSCGKHMMDDVTVPSDGSGTIVSIGVQTNAEQKEFAIVQLFVSENGSQAYAQVYNSSGSPTEWNYYVTYIS